jgi:hypothetical protein
MEGSFHTKPWCGEVGKKTGDIFIVLAAGHHRRAHQLSNPQRASGGTSHLTHTPTVAIAPQAGNPENSLTSSTCTTA